MTFSQIMAQRERRVSVEPVLLPHDEAIAFMGGSEALFLDMREAGWFRAVVSRHRLALYSVEQLRAAATRLVSGEEPPRRSRRPD